MQVGRQKKGIKTEIKVTTIRKHEQNPKTRLVLNIGISNFMLALFGNLILMKYRNKFVPDEKNAGYYSSPSVIPTEDRLYENVMQILKTFTQNLL